MLHPSRGAGDDGRRASSGREGRRMKDTEAPATEAAETKTAIIEDQRDIREGLAMLINGSEGYRCTGSYRSVEEALDKIKYDLPDVVLSDIGLPGMDGIEGIRIIKERYPTVLL